MNTIYKKTLKGVEEAALRTQGLQLKLRAYLKLVDGKHSTVEIQCANPNLAEIETVLGVLQQEGYVEVSC